MNAKEPVKKVLDNPATENIRDVLVIRPINILVRAPVMPEAQALLVAENIHNAHVQTVMNGRTEAANNKFCMELSVIYTIVTAFPSPPKQVIFHFGLAYTTRISQLGRMPKLLAMPIIFAILPMDDYPHWMN